MVGALVVATLLLSDRVDESIACPVKANETNELQQLFLIMDEEASVRGYQSRWTRAVEDQSAPIPRDIMSKLGGSMYIVRRAQSRINQATLENDMGNWKDARSGRNPPISLSSQSGHESLWIHLMNLF